MHIISLELKFYVDCQNGIQYTVKAIYDLTNDPSRMVEIIGIRNDAFHELVPGHLPSILWQYAVSDLYIFDHQRDNISSGSMLLGAFHTARRPKVDHFAIWSFVKCGFLPFSCFSQFVIMEIIYSHCKLRIEDVSRSLGQDLRLEHMLIVDSICHQMSCVWWNGDHTGIWFMTLNDAYHLQSWKEQQCKICVGYVKPHFYTHWK